MKKEVQSTEIDWRKKVSIISGEYWAEGGESGGLCHACAFASH